MIKNAPPMMAAGQPSMPMPMSPHRNGLVSAMMSQPVRPPASQPYNGPGLNPAQLGEMVGQSGAGPESPTDQFAGMVKAGATPAQAGQAVTAGSTDAYAQGMTPPPMGLGAQLGSALGINPAATPSRAYAGLPTSFAATSTPLAGTGGW